MNQILSVHPLGFYAKGAIAMSTSTGKKASFSFASLIAIIAAIFSFKVGAIGGFLLALVAIVFGLIGVALAAAPSVRGGLLSIFAIFAGGIGVIAAVWKAISYLLSAL
ncbi:MAG: hypothetical protein QM627_07475 [Luteolibacter sp.]